MKKILLVVACILLTVGGHAQPEAGSWTVTPKVGVNWASLSDGDIYYGAGANDKVSLGMKRGFVVGAEAEYQLYGGVAFSVGMLFSRQGARNTSRKAMPLAIGRSSRATSIIVHSISPYPSVSLTTSTMSVWSCAITMGSTTRPNTASRSEATCYSSPWAIVSGCSFTTRQCRSDSSAPR